MVCANHKNMRFVQFMPSLASLAGYSAVRSCTLNQWRSSVQTESTR